MEEEESIFDLGTGMTVITIIFNDDHAPKVDLGGCNPMVAAGVFRLAADQIDSIIIAPTILNNGDILCSEEEYILEFDDDDE